MTNARPGWLGDFFLELSTFFQKNAKIVMGV